MTAYTEVLFEEIPGSDGHLGVITLNRPEALNALNHAMIKAMYPKLQQWAVAGHIKAVVIRAAEGRAFCAGGDLRLTHQRSRSNDVELTDFFHDEYQLNRFIFHFPKPYIAFLDGITMGGGVGISIHGSHRIATERLLFAMPETGIGFFPDVGGTYFLPRLSSHLGYYLGLSGARIKSDDCVAIGIAQTKVARESLPTLLQALAERPFVGDAHKAVSAIIHQFAIAAGPSSLIAHQQALDACFAKTSMEEIVDALEHSSEPLCKEAAAAIATKSPTSLKITLRALHEGKHLDFNTCMRHEFRLCCRFLHGHDFMEGIRAVIIDKDQKPQWKPATLAAVTQADVESYFAPLSKELA